MCAWRATCNKKFAKLVEFPLRCPEYTRDVTLRSDQDPPPKYPVIRTKEQIQEWSLRRASFRIGDLINTWYDTTDEFMQGGSAHPYYGTVREALDLKLLGEEENIGHVEYIISQLQGRPMKYIEGKWIPECQILSLSQ
jgi:hypothetical protein